MEQNQLSLQAFDILIFCIYFLLICLIGFWAGRKKKADSEDFFLAGRTLPWYIVGSSFIAANISSEHFIGMIGAAYIYGICVAMWEWGNILSFTVLIWLFIPFLIATKVFTTPEFMEKRFNSTLRQFFAIVTCVSNIVAFLAAVIYGGGIAINKLFGIDIGFSIIILGVFAGIFATYGGLKSVAWMDGLTIIIMILGGLTVTVFGLYALSGEHNSLVEGFKVMIECNRANDGAWAEAVKLVSQKIAHIDNYNRLSVIQPVTHELAPWPSLVFGFLSIGIWYSVINQFMIQRVLAAKNMYHARMGVVLAGYLKIVMPTIVVIPGLILFAMHPEILMLPWNEVRPKADQSYISMIQTIVPIGMRGLLLAALYGAIQSTVSAVLNSTSTIFTMDIYKRVLNKAASEKHLVFIGRIATVFIMIISIVLAFYISTLKTSLFVYIQELYAFFAPPFAAVFVLGILFRRINAFGATMAVFLGFIFGVLMKIYVQFVPDHYVWIEPFGMQAIANWLFCVIVCLIGSLLTKPPRAEQVEGMLTLNWKKLNIFTNVQIGDKWYTNVLIWWGLFAALVIVLVVIFSGIFCWD